MQRRGELTARQAVSIAIRLQGWSARPPLVGIIGKTGVGKSRLCNALLGPRTHAAPIDHVTACTRGTAEYWLPIGGCSDGLRLVDLPGVGESAAHDQDYLQLYRRLAPTFDAVIWVVKADDRAFSIEREALAAVRSVVPRIRTIVAINQVEKIEPMRRSTHGNPSNLQRANVREKLEATRRVFGSAKQIVGVSAVERINLGELLIAVVECLPMRPPIPGR